MQKLIKLNAKPGTSETAKVRAVLKQVSNMDELEQLFFILKMYLDEGVKPECEVWIDAKEDE